MTLKRNAILGMIAVLAATLAACSAASGTDPLAGTDWVLQSLDGNQQVGAAIGGKDVTLSFDEEHKVGGSAGCNSYGGGYELGAASGSITISQLVSTLMACVDENVMVVESQFLAALGEAQEFTISGETLTLTGGGHTLIFVQM